MIKATISENDSHIEIKGIADELCAEFAGLTEHFIYMLLANSGYKSAEDMKEDAAQLATGFALSVRNGLNKAREEVFGE